MLKINHYNLYNSSYFKRNSGQSLDWCPSDTEELYNKNYKENFELLKSSGWIDRKFKYTFNSHGFRCEEFTNEDSIMFLGCSYTMGIGLPIEDTWSNIVAKKVNLQYVNLAIGGGSNDTAFRFCLGWIDRIKPKMVIFLEPPGFRIELVNGHKNKIVSINDRGRYPEFINEWNLTDDNNYLNALKNNLAIQALCDIRNIKYFHFKFNQLTDNWSDWARDLMHPGPNTHLRFAHYVIDQIKK